MKKMPFLCYSSVCHRCFYKILFRQIETYQLSACVIFTMICQTKKKNQTKRLSLGHDYSRARLNFRGIFDNDQLTTRSSACGSATTSGSFARLLITLQGLVWFSVAFLWWMTWIGSFLGNAKGMCFATWMNWFRHILYSWLVTNSLISDNTFALSFAVAGLLLTSIRILAGRGFIFLTVQQYLRLPINGSRCNANCQKKNIVNFASRYRFVTKRSLVHCSLRWKF